MAHPSDPDMTAILTGILNETAGPIIKGGLNGTFDQDALDSVQDLVGGVHDVFAAETQLRADLADLDSRRDLIPAQGFQRIRADAINDATAKADDAQRVAQHALGQLTASLEHASLPTFEPAREQLARDECALAFSTGDPEAQALRLASYGNDEALAALLSPWGTTLLVSRGVKDPDRVLADVRKIAVAHAKDRADTPARAALKSLTDLATVVGQSKSGINKLTRYGTAA